MRNANRRLKVLEVAYATLHAQPHRELTREDWICFARWGAVTIAYWLGAATLEPWARLYSGISAGNASSDIASPIRHSLRERFRWAADMKVGEAATGRVNTDWTQALELLPQEKGEALYAAYTDLENRHPDLIGPSEGYGPYYRVTLDGRLTECDSTEAVRDLPLAAFGIEAGIAALKQEEMDREAREMRHG